MFTSTFLLHCALLCLGASPVFAIPKCTASCNQWAACEIDLTTVNGALSDDTLYGIRPAATINRLNADGTVAQSIPVSGFFYERDASNRGKFKVRFNPPAAANYNYTITSAYQFTLNDPTTFTCGAVAPLPGGGANRGFLRIDPSNPQSFIWDDAVTRFFMWGQTYYQIVNKARKALNDQLAGLTPDDASWQTPVLQSATYRMNKIRMLVSPWGGDDRLGAGFETKAFQKNVDGTLNRDKIDVRHWQALDRVVDFLYAQGIVADLILFHDGDNTTSPFGTTAQNQKYTRYATARYAAYPNVTWSLANEYQLVAGATNASWTDLGCLIRGGCGGYTSGADPWFTRGSYRRPLSIHRDVASLSYPCFEFFNAGWATYASLQSKRSPVGTVDQTAFDAVARNRNPADVSPCSGLTNATKLPVVDDEYGYVEDFSATYATDRTAHRKALWGVVTAGGFGSAGSLRGVYDPTLYTDWQDEPDHYGDIKRMVDLFTTNLIPYWKMSPMTNSGTGPVHMLGVGGAAPEYVIYSASGSTVTANNLVTGGYKKTVFNPSTGASTVINCCLLSTSTAVFNVSSSADWVVWLRGKSCAATSPSCAP